MALRATEPVPDTHLDAFDWGEGVLTLRTRAGGRYLSFGPDRTLVNSADQPHGWYVQQQFRLVPHGGGHVLEYAGNETGEAWFGDRRYVLVRADGVLGVDAASADEATVFAREVVRDGVEESVAAARDADAAVVVVGSMPFINGREADDRASTDLAPGQQALLEAVRAANPRTVLVLTTSYPTTITWADEHVPAILWTTHAGAETGNAVADVLTGRANPSGRLTQTWYRSVEELPDIRDYDIISRPRTYQYYGKDPLYPFGHGLSYTTFEYGRPRLNRRVVSAEGAVSVEVRVTNTGSRAGSEVVQLYTHQRGSRDPQPRLRLRGFERVTLDVGASTTVRFRLRAADLAHYDVTRSRWVVESAVHDVLVGASAGDLRGRTVLRVSGERIPARNLFTVTEAETFDDYTGVTLTDRDKERGTAVTPEGERGWIRFRDVDLRGGVHGITVEAARPEPGPGRVEVRLGGPEGRVLGVLSVPSTGDRYAYTTVRTRLSPAHGRRDICLVLDTPARLATLRLHR